MKRCQACSREASDITEQGVCPGRCTGRNGVTPRPDPVQAAPVDTEWERNVAAENEAYDTYHRFGQVGRARIGRI